MAIEQCLLVCDYLYPEVEQAAREIGVDGVQVIRFAADCDRPLQAGDGLEGALGQCPPGSRVHLLGGECLAGVADRLPPGRIEPRPDGSCFEPLAGATLIGDYLARGYHLLTPAMLADFERKQAEWGFAPGEARAFFDESSNRLLLLDSGLDPQAATRLEEVAGRLAVTAERLPLGLDHLRLWLSRLLAAPAVPGNTDAEQRLADYAMSYDLLSGIAALTDEEAVIEQLLELFMMFCAPARVIFQPWRDGAPGQPLHTPAFSEPEPGELGRLQEEIPGYLRDDATAGFRIPIERQGERLGQILVSGVSFPQYLGHYLNLALEVAPVLALAIDNARTYEHRLRAEAQVRALNRELEQRLITVDALNHELETFTYSVSHDLRGPLRSLDGFSSILLRDYAAQLDDRARHYLERLRANATRMGQLIDDLLHLSRLTRTELVRSDQDLSAICDELAGDLQQTAAGREVEFRIAPAIHADCDPQLVRGALENLIGNAWKYTGKTPRAVIEFGETERDGERLLFVRDNGDGFDMAYADKLFLPFQRLHTEEQFPGSGIGLATVQRVIQRHGGRILAEAAPGAGATFYFTLG